jgi:hypothetical protein
MGDTVCIDRAHHLNRCTMTGMNWQRLARAIVDRRVERGLKTREALLAVIKGTKWELSRRVLADLETGKRDNYDQATLSRLEKALEWPQGEVYRVLRGVEPVQPEPVDLEEEFATFAGLTKNLYRIDPGILAGLLHRSGLPFDDVYDLVMAERAEAVAQLRENWQRLAEQIRQRGGRVEVGTWPPWLEPPPIVEEIRRGEP